MCKHPVRQKHLARLRCWMRFEMRTGPLGCCALPLRAVAGAGAAVSVAGSAISSALTPPSSAPPADGCNS